MKKAGAKAASAASGAKSAVKSAAKKGMEKATGGDKSEKVEAEGLELNLLQTIDLEKGEGSGSKDASDSPDIEETPATSTLEAEAPPLLPSTEVKTNEAWWHQYMNKGDLSNMCTFLLMVIGILLHSKYSDSTFVKYFLAFGLFGFAGGITNWLAVKMLFDKIPFIVGSGVIPRQFKVIRETVKDTIMKTFFDGDYLESYINERSKSLLGTIDIGQKIQDTMTKEGFDELLIEKLTDISNKPEGMMLTTMAPMFGGISGMVPMIKPMLISFGKEMGDQLAENFDPLEYVTVDKVRAELDSLMTEKLKLLTPEIVKKLMEEVIRTHLGWLIVWGNVFGGLIGVVSQAAGYGA